MTTHLTAQQMQNYLVRRLSIGELGSLGEHLHGCRSCYQAYLSVLQTRFPIEIDFDELAGLKDWHLEGEQLVDYLGGGMNQADLDYARLHLQECGSCHQRVYDNAKNWPEHSASTEGAQEKYEGPWRKYLPAFHSIPSSRWQFAAALLLVIGFALVLWGVLQSGPEKTQVAQEKRSGTIPSNNVPDRATAPTTAPLGTGSDRSVESSAHQQIAIARNSDTGEVGRRKDQDELALIAKDLTMPPAIEVLDRTPSMAVRGNQTSVQSFTIVRPFTTAISDDRPTFSWTTLDGATSYTVSVFDADLHLIRTSEPLTETQWLIPHRLDAGIVYTWTVTALKDGQEIVSPAPPARAEFKILGEPDLRKLKRMVSRTVSHAARGVLYAEAGLLDEAEKEFQTHLKLRPADERVKGLLRIVKSWRVVT